MLLESWCRYRMMHPPFLEVINISTYPRRFSQELSPSIFVTEYAKCGETAGAIACLNSVIRLVDYGTPRATENDQRLRHEAHLLVARLLRFSDRDTALLHYQQHLHRYFSATSISNCVGVWAYCIIPIFFSLESCSKHGTYAR